MKLLDEATLLGRPREDVIERAEDRNDDGCLRVVWVE